MLSNALKTKLENIWSPTSTVGFSVDICLLNPVFYKQCSRDSTNFNWRLWSVFQWSVILHYFDTLTLVIHRVHLLCLLAQNEYYAFLLSFIGKHNSVPATTVFLVHHNCMVGGSIVSPTGNTVLVRGGMLPWSQWARHQYHCSEISCNVKWNVYLAMEIPDCVSFISGQNSDDRVRSCEPNVFLA